MSQTLNSHISNCYNSVKKLFVLREIVKSTNEKGVALISTQDIPNDTKDSIDCLLDLMQSKIVDIPEFKEDIEVLIPWGAEEHGLEERYYHYFKVIPVRNIKEVYFNEIRKIKKSLSGHLNLMDTEKQLSVVNDLINKKKSILSKSYFEFSFEDLPETQRSYINLYFVLIYLEMKEAELSIVQAYQPFVKEGEGDEERNIVFQINVGKPILGGDNYTIDLRDCTIKFDNENEACSFKSGNETYRLLQMFVLEGKKRISHEEVAQRVSKGKELNDKEDLSNYVKGLLLRIRRDVLEGSCGGKHDILINKRGFVMLRGVN